jgi:hypothetical protein
VCTATLLCLSRFFLRKTNTMGSKFCRIRAEKPDEREREVRHYLGWLTGDARQCSENTDKILWCHAQFACLMAQQIGGGTKSGPKGPDCSTDTRRLANIIATASRSLSQNVVKMKGDLDSFVSYLEKMQVKKEQSMVQRVLGWLKLLFNALAGIFALGSFIAPFLHPVAPGVDLIAPAASALSMAAAELCEMAAGTSLGMSVRTNKRSDRRLLTQSHSRRKSLRPSSPCFYSSRRQFPGRHEKHGGHWHNSTKRSFSWGWKNT